MASPEDNDEKKLDRTIHPAPSFASGRSVSASSYLSPDKVPGAPKSAPLSFSSPSAGGGGGFMSLGESSVAERARRLREVRNKAAANSSAAKTAPQTPDRNTDDATIASTASVDETVDKASLHEFDFLLISNQTEEKENLFQKSLMKGFRSLKESREASDNYVTEEQRRYSATVNFIDPTTKPKIASAPASAPPMLATNAAKPDNLLQQQSMLAKRVGSTTSQVSVVSTQIENVYEKLTNVFEEEYKSTIRSVQHKNPRTGEVNTIRSLPVRPVITMAGGKTECRSPISAAWGASNSMLPGSDPSEWHNGPICHVYIAACENVDHYRTKVRPSLKAFVSQLESSESNTTANQQGGHSADYLIVYIPIGGDSKPKDYSSTTNVSSGRSNSSASTRRGFFGFGSRSSNAESQGDDDDKSKDSVDSGDERMDMGGLDESDREASGGIKVLTSFKHLSRQERSLYKKIVTNFPNGKVCVLSPHSLETAVESDEVLATRVQEWNVFNRLLGQVIVNGFQDRVRRYKAELKRLDAQRASAATAAKSYVIKSNGSNSPSKPNPYAFNLSHFFLVKESLAFSYEQMQLPAEALLQYDEFRLYMPDLSDKDEPDVRAARQKSKALQEGPPSLSRLADAGDFLAFRKRMRTEYDLTAILDIMRRYLFARELSLLFRMEHPVELLARSKTFIKSMYAIILRGISELEQKEQDERKMKAATWMIQFSWDIYCAAEQYLRTPSDTTTSQHRRPQSDEAVGAKLSEILEVSRQFLLQLAKDHPDSLESFTIRRNKIPADMMTSWQPWKPCKQSTSESEDTSTNAATERKFLISLKDTLKSIEKFDEAYFKLCGAIIDTRRIAKQQRLSARIQAEVGEYHASKGDLHKAAASFSNIVKIYRLDHWDRSHFWRVFRLAYCQRTTVEPAVYLKTLCSCFSPRTMSIAPKKALEALFEDLKRVIEHPSIGNARYSRLLFIETSLSVASKSNKSQVGRILDQKELEKRFCTVGEKIKLPFSITSHLPGPIELTSVKLFAVSADVFKNILERGDAIQEEDAAKVLSLNTPIKLNPGKNDFAFDWSPQRSGQYILSTIEILWKEGYFYYDSMDLQEPLLSIEVEPNAPTHSISMEPKELIPGHEQEVKITFESGADLINSVKLILSGTDGIKLIPPGEDVTSSEWKQDWFTDLQPMKPGEKQTVAVQVRCSVEAKNLSPSEDDDSLPARGLFAKALTSFTYSSPEYEELESQESTRKAFIPALEKTTMSVDSIETHWLEANERFMLSIVLTSNWPSRLSVDEWNMKMASPIVIQSATDMNQCLIQRSIYEGDSLSFVFECSIDKEKRDEFGSSKENSMCLKFCDDEGKILWIDLPLDLGDFYSWKPKPLSSIPTETIPATLSLETNRGLAGEPLAITFVVDTSKIAKNCSKLVYAIESTGGNWLLGGKISGFLPTSGIQHLSCIGVPVLPGVLEQFPSLKVERFDSAGRAIPIHVDCQSPDSFDSIPMAQVNAIAMPRYEERASV